MHDIGEATQLPLLAEGGGNPYLPPQQFTKEALKSLYEPYEGLTYAQIEATLLSSIAPLLGTGPLPETQLTNKSRKWRVISGYQKCIRRSEPEVAYRAASAVFRAEASYFMRRMSIVMLEDVGIANLPLCALSIALQGKMKWVRSNGDLRIPMFITKVASENPTDRTLCEVAVTSWFSPDLLDVKKEFYELSFSNPEELAAMVSSSDPAIAHLSAMALIGGLVYEGEKSNSNRSLYAETISSLGLPRLMEYVIIKAMGQALEGLPNALPVLWGSFTGASVITRPLPEGPLIAGLPSVAYDKHCYEGQRAIRTFASKCTAISEFLTSIGMKDKALSLVGSAVFEEEGGNVLKQSLTYQFQRDCLVTARRAHLVSTGMTEGQAEELCKLVRENLPLLNKIRMVSIE